jgi:putative membrane protein insertion efficiency factor
MRRWLAGVIVAILLVAIDLGQPPAEQWSTHAAVSAIHLYQMTLSKWYTRIGVRCRFTPTCSNYAEVCLRRFGAVRGGVMAARRVLRCGPWTAMGTVDPPPLGS